VITEWRSVKIWTGQYRDYRVAVSEIRGQIVRVIVVRFHNKGIYLLGYIAR